MIANIYSAREMLAVLLFKTHTIYLIQSIGHYGCCRNRRTLIVFGYYAIFMIGLNMELFASRYNKHTIPSIIAYVVLHKLHCLARIQISEHNASFAEQNSLISPLINILRCNHTIVGIRFHNMCLNLNWFTRSNATLN